MSAAEPNDIAIRDPDLVLARLHLRLGSLALARSELETLAGRDALDDSGLLDLAEARWRTGDITGAGEAAAAALHDEEGPLLALVVAAEAAASRGRPTESRRLADKAMVMAGGAIDAVFAGMPRAAVWPPDAAAPPPSPTTMFDPPRRGVSAVHRHPRPQDESAAASAAETVARIHAIASDEADAATVGLWEADADISDSADADIAIDPTAAVEVDPGADDDEALDLPAGDIELDLGRAALEANDPDEAAIRLGLVLRITPALAPAVLDVIEGRTEAGIALVRGDAYRLVGRELEARRAFVEAARGQSSSRPARDADPSDPPDHTDPTDQPVSPETPPEGDPA
jgi:hypothetical protein